MLSKNIKSCVIKFLCISITLSVLIPQTSYAKTRKTEAKSSINIENEDTKELLKRFPYLKKDWNKRIKGIVDTVDTYYKFIPRRNSISNKDKQKYALKSYQKIDDAQNDFIIKKYTKEEYLNELVTPKIYRSAIGEQEGGTCSWLKISLQVYNNNKGGYSVFNFSAWQTPPVCRFQDAIGVSFSSGIIASGDKSTRGGQYIYYSPFGEQHDICHNLYVQVEKYGRGVMASFELYRSAREQGASKAYHEANIGTDVEYTNNNIRSGWITGQYVHKQLSFGSFSLVQMVR